MVLLLYFTVLKQRFPAPAATGFELINFLSLGMWDDFATVEWDL
jgi:hypothetical protein